MWYKGEREKKGERIRRAIASVVCVRSFADKQE